MIRKRLPGSGLLLFLLLPILLPAQEDSAELTLPGKQQEVTWPLLYQFQKRKTTTASLSAIYSPDLQKTISATFGGMLTGRLAGLFTSQTSGEPGNDDVSVFLRGQSPMILVDGTPQSFPSINPEQIESITLLKDALSTAMLGMRGGNGAILITTKKGSKEKQRLEFTAIYGTQQPTEMPQYLRAYDYATLYNEALINDGRPALYTQADLDAYRSGGDPIGHPDVDWQKQLLKNQAPFGRYDLAISGGGKTARYFVNLDYMNQGGLLKEEDFNVYKTNVGYKRYIIRSNIEVDLNRSITAALNLFGRIQRTNQPGISAGDIFNNLRNTPNNAYPVKNEDGSLGGTLDYQNNLYGQSVWSGYRPIYERDFKVDLSLHGKLDVIAKGLWIKLLGAVNAYERETTNRSKSFAVYKQTEGAGGKAYTKYGNTGDQANATAINSQNRLFYTELSMGYAKTIQQDHHLDVLALASNDNRFLNSDLPFNYSGISGKVSYDYKQKYLVEVAAGYNGTERLPKNNRYGFFPAFGLGWNLANESFLQNKVKWLQALKLRASYGKSGNANVGYYDYYQYYTTGSGYGFGSTVPSSSTTLQEGQLANPLITWEKANKFTVGIDAGLFSNKLQFSVDYFNDKYYDLLQQRSNGSTILGTGYIDENIGSNRFSGVEIDLKWQGGKGDLTYFIAPNLTWLKSKVLYMAEPAWMYEWMRRTGRPVGQSFGYVAEGLLANQQEIAAHAYQGGNIVPGDIKYKDLNGDNLIDGNDQQAIGNTKPAFRYGLNAGINFKGFDLNILLQGVARNYVFLTSGDYRAFQNDGKGQATEVHLNRWTPSNTTNATYPRLWVGYNANNMLTSSYWLRNADYLRIKYIELGYSLPASLTKKVKMTVTRLFVGATNLFTITALDGIDPEGYVGGYPIMKTLHAGINIKF